MRQAGATYAEPMMPALFGEVVRGFELYQSSAYMYCASVVVEVQCDIEKLQGQQGRRDPATEAALQSILNGMSAAAFARLGRKRALTGDAAADAATVRESMTAMIDNPDIVEDYFRLMRREWGLRTINQSIAHRLLLRREDN